MYGYHKTTWSSINPFFMNFVSSSTSLRESLYICLQLHDISRQFSNFLSTLLSTTYFQIFFFRFPTNNIINTIKHKNIYTDMSVVNVDYMNDNTPALPQLLSSLNDRWFNHVSSFSCSFVASKSYNWENPSSILEIEQDPMHILQTISQGC